MQEHQPDNPPQTPIDAADAAVAEASVADVAVAEAAPPQRPTLVGLINRRMHYPNTYVWLLLFSALDIMLTWVILHLRGQEVNPLARAVIDKWALNGMIIYKFALIIFFIMMCEIVGSLRMETGRMLSRTSVAIASVPVVWSLFLLARYALDHT